MDRLRRNEQGSITAFVVVMTTALLMAIGLVLDGGRALALRRVAADRAQEAARAGAQVIDVDALRAHRSAVPGRGAGAAARAYLARLGTPGSVRVSGGRVIVTVHLATPTRLLSLVGMRTISVSETGAARIVRGVTRGET